MSSAVHASPPFLFQGPVSPDGAPLGAPAFEEFRQLQSAPVDARLDRAERYLENRRHLLVAHPLQIPEDDRLTQLRRQAVDDLPEEGREIFLLERAVGIVSDGGIPGDRDQLLGLLAVDDHRALPPPLPIMIDCVVPSDSLEPGGKAPARLEAAENR